MVIISSHADYSLTKIQRNTNASLLSNIFVFCYNVEIHKCTGLYGNEHRLSASETGEQDVLSFELAQMLMIDHDNLVVNVPITSAILNNHIGEGKNDIIVSPIPLALPLHSCGVAVK